MELKGIIRLTMQHDGGPLWVNMGDVSVFTNAENGPGTELYVRGGGALFVAEEPEEVIRRTMRAELDGVHHSEEE